jgi:hypothetical protein
MNAAPGQVMTPMRPMTVVTTSMDTSAFSTYQIVAFIIIFIIFASIVYYTRNFFLAEWKKFYPVNELTGETPLQAALNSQDNINKSGPATIDYSKATGGSSSQSTGVLMGAEVPTKADPVLEGPASAEQTWCLVGEDMAGRWCIQVQSPNHCEPIRTYKTKNQCEKSNDTPL